jgi:alkanesulfonate monooxygenase SsuD/methylene tetrahydromethanopterin reductase-like flavin-dependent oxidoreductase (luciferase family)
MAIRHGIILTSGDPREALRLGVAAEAAGWDGVFGWDAISIGGGDVPDPWTLLAAIAARTERVTLGAMVFAPVRRRPWTLAKQAITVDHLSNGRLVLPMGLGTPDDAGFATVGEPVDARTRAARLDETLAILDGLQRGTPFAFKGEHYRFGKMTVRPLPVQRPRIPVWVVGAWPSERSMRRAARWDGIVIQGAGADGGPSNNPSQLEDAVAWIRRERAAAGLEGPYEIVASGSTAAGDPAGIAEIAAAEAAGATWWIEGDWMAARPDALERRIDAGPNRG